MSGTGSAYRPEELSMLRRVMDEAVGTLPVALRTPIAKASIAKNLLDRAAAGERDPIELRLAALAGFNGNSKHSAAGAAPNHPLPAAESRKAVDRRP
jgi:hypothetical protein